MRCPIPFFTHSSELEVMNRYFATAISPLLALTQVALFTVSLILILFPATRTEGLRAIFGALFFISCAVVVVRAFRLGYARDSTAKILDKLQSGGTPVMRSSLERFSFVSAVVAATVLTFS